MSNQVLPPRDTKPKELYIQILPNFQRQIFFILHKLFQRLKKDLMRPK